MLLHLDFSLETPIYQQIRNQIVQGIAHGDLRPGDGLPTVRGLAQDCGINMMTVSKAYSLLKQEGYIETDRRAGTRVSRTKQTGLPAAVREALELALAEAKAAGARKEDVLAIVDEMYWEV